MYALTVVVTDTNKYIKKLTHIPGTKFRYLLRERYNGLVNMGYKTHYRIKHGKNEFVNGKNHINGIEILWSLAKRRLEKFHGISKEI